MEGKQAVTCVTACFFCEDRGRFLGIGDGSWGSGTVPGDQGRFLGVRDGSWGSGTVPDTQEPSPSFIFLLSQKSVGLQDPPELRGVPKALLDDCHAVHTVVQGADPEGKSFRIGCGIAV